MRESERKLKKHSSITLADFAVYVTDMVDEVDVGEIGLEEAISEVVLKTEGL